ncbi:hypothetical protein [Rhizobium sp. Root1220]|nr:hypothetical protein [Rhizobium sp. Root1220]
MRGNCNGPAGLDDSGTLSSQAGWRLHFGLTVSDPLSVDGLPARAVADG